jgi:beta-fructofuranosidase
MQLTHRPQYHFMPQANWMNDPNGLIQWKGVYHLFYQYNPTGVGFGSMHWAHASSRDLVHWTHLPVALAPTPGGPDRDGVWSGCAVDNDGVPTLVYTGVRPQVQCLATSDDELIEWTKDLRNPVIAGPPEGLDATGFRDPCVWRECGHWYLVLGSGARGVGGMILLYRSDDLHVWEYVGPLLEGKIAETGHNWECPNYLGLGDRRLLIFSPEPFRQAHYYVGDQVGFTFVPQTHGLLDHGGLYYAPQAFGDESGRRITFGWLLEGRTQEAVDAAGWAGVQSLPRELSLGPDGDLRQRPVPELASLRAGHYQMKATVWEGRQPVGIAGSALELDLVIDPRSATEVTLELLASPHCEECTKVNYDPGRRVLTMDTRGASLDAGAQGRLAEAPLTLEDGALFLRVFVDRSVIEVFANDRVCLTGRAYPTRADATGVALVSSGGTAALQNLDAWTMSSIWSSRQ